MQWAKSHIATARWQCSHLLAEVDEAVSVGLHGGGVLRQWGQVVAAGAALGAVPVVAAAVLVAPDLLGVRAGEHGPALPCAVVEEAGAAVAHLQVELDVDDVGARVDGLGHDVPLERLPSVEVSAVGVANHHPVAVAQTLDGILVGRDAESSYSEPDLAFRRRAAVTLNKNITSVEFYVQ